ncbi:hypothetical protein BB560_006523 [Smittium megazygosporum]|uniref:Protein root UVB sensitive/RUS domain-containing protein n=1 Tax=Smittium megazygosporum TaxID=133381 RepID=A0A2T9Y4I5_9FUNG|nr:hypothetical protein BB560_006523 [Smittium megazygosporum]
MTPRFLLARPNSRYPYLQAHGGFPGRHSFKIPTINNTHLFLFERYSSREQRAHQSTVPPFKHSSSTSNKVFVSQNGRSSFFSKLKHKSSRSLYIYSAETSSQPNFEASKPPFFGTPLKYNIGATENKGKYRFLPLQLVASTMSFFKTKVKASTKFTISAFLPDGFPNSVAREYPVYMKWAFIENVLGSAASVLSVQSLLYAVGLGSTAIPLSATITWVLKDGIGQLGGVLYASFIGKDFDKDPKRLRFWSTASLQAAVWLEMLTPLFPSFFLLIASFANVLKNICYLTIGATKASINKSLSLNDNLGDVTAKYGSQATAAGLIGTAFGISMSSLVASNLTGLIILFIPLSAISAFASYSSVKSLRLKSLNLERSSRVLRGVVKLRNGNLYLEKDDKFNYENISSLDSILRKNHNPFGFNSKNLELNISPSLTVLELGGLLKNDHTTFGNQTYSSICCPQLADNFSESNENYYLVVETPNKKLEFEENIAKQFKVSVSLFFKHATSNKDKLKGIYHAYCLSLLIQYHQAMNWNLRIGSSPSIDFHSEIYHQINSLKETSSLHVSETFLEFCNIINELGWDLNSIQFDNIKNEISVNRG